jgi:sugar lactone lactonase YvrE
MRRRLPPLVLFLAACSTSARAPSAPTPQLPVAGGWRAELAAHRATDPDDQGALYAAAYVAAEGGDTEGALALLGRLDALGWDFPMQDADFAPLAKLPRFRALADRAAARVPEGGPARVAFSVGPPDLVPEGIACDGSGAVFVGSLQHRKVLRVDGGVARDLVPARAGGLGSVLGMTVDAPRRRLWLAHNPGRGDAGGRSGVRAVGVDDGATQVDVALDGRHLLNDVALSGAGELFVTDSSAGTVWRLAAGGAALERLVPDDSFFYPNGIVWFEARGALVVADVSGLHELDPKSGARRRLARGPATGLGGVDGLARHGDSFIAIQNGYRGPRVMRWRFDPRTLAITASERLQGTHPAFHVPTTGCVAGDRYLFIANSYVGERDAAGNFRDPSILRPLDVLELPL